MHLVEFRVYAVAINQFKNNRRFTIFIFMNFDIVTNQMFSKKGKAEGILYSVIFQLPIVFWVVILYSGLVPRLPNAGIRVLFLSISCSLTAACDSASASEPTHTGLPSKAADCGIISHQGWLSIEEVAAFSGIGGSDTQCGALYQDCDFHPSTVPIPLSLQEF